MAANLKRLALAFDGEFLVMATCFDHHLTCTESYLGDALFVARQLARDGWAVRVQGQDERNLDHRYDFKPGV